MEEEDEEDEEDEEGKDAKDNVLSLEPEGDNVEEADRREEVDEDATARVGCASTEAVSSESVGTESKAGKVGFETRLTECLLLCRGDTNAFA